MRWGKSLCFAPHRLEPMVIQLSELAVEIREWWALAVFTMLRFWWYSLARVYNRSLGGMNNELCLLILSYSFFMVFQRFIIPIIQRPETEVHSVAFATEACRCCSLATLAVDDGSGRWAFLINKCWKQRGVSSTFAWAWFFKNFYFFFYNSSFFPGA